MSRLIPDEWDSFKYDITVGFIGALVLLIVLLIWLRIPPITTLINEPCAPSQPIITNGERLGDCTGDKPNPRPGFYQRGQRGADSYRNLHRQSVAPVSVLDRQNQ